MNRSLRSRQRHDVVAIPIVWVAVLLSLLVHVAALWLGLPPLMRFSSRHVDESSPLAVQLAPLASETARSASIVPSLASAEPAPSEKPQVTQRKSPRQESPPLRTLDRPALRPLEPELAMAPEPTVPSAPKPQPMPPAPAKDLETYIEAQRRARGETLQPPSQSRAESAAERDLARRDRIVAANLGLDRTPTYGPDPRNAGGIFQIKEIGYDTAQFYFFGFDQDINRNARQLFEVRRGGEGDIRIAIVRKMIAIIRANIAGDFIWISERQGRVMLSARPEDNAGLESFIMRDLFPDVRLP